MYTIGQVSEMFDLPVSTLRYYDKEGLFPSMQRQAGIRKFGETEVEALKVIECLKASGLEIKDIRKFMQWCTEGPSTYAQRKELFEARKNVVEADMMRLQKTLDMLEFKCRYYETAIRDGSEEKLKNMIPDGLQTDRHKTDSENRSIFYIVDAFASEHFGGNPAGVVIFNAGEAYPEDILMQKTAAELRYSETVFIVPQADGSFDLRYFTPASEVELCGHATVGCFAAMTDAGLAGRGKSYTAHTKAGDISVEIGADGDVLMDMAKPETAGEITDPAAVERLYDICGIPCEVPEINGKKLFPRIVSTGLPDIMLAVKDRETLNSIETDAGALTAVSKEYNAVSLHAYAIGEGPVTAYARDFAPLYGINEEAATGTASGSLTETLYSYGLIKPGDRNLFIQGEAMGRPSRIITSLEVENSARKIRVGGSAVILAKGHFNI